MKLQHTLFIALFLTVAGCSANAEPKIKRVEKYDIGPDAEILQIHRETHDATKLGRGEVKSWDERYWGKNLNVPYRGPQHNYRVK